MCDLHVKGRTGGKVEDREVRLVGDVADLGSSSPRGYEPGCLRLMPGWRPPRRPVGAFTCGSEREQSLVRIVTSANASDGTLTTTSGPNNASGGFIPQLFLSVRALALNIKTSPRSTAVVNISVSTSNPVVSVFAQVNTSIQPILIIGLAEDRLTTLALTFDQSNVST
ncbi:hypothetical protein K466DRAFT_566729, partial [Polyporus arcularius HHB13444]